MSRYRLLAGVLALSLGSFVLTPAAGALPNAGASPGVTHEAGACIWWYSSSQQAALCAFVGAGAQNGPYSFAWYSRRDGTTSVWGTINPLDFHEDPTGTSATLDTTDYNGCRMTFSLTATPATPIDGIQPSVPYYADPPNGFGAGASYTRDLPASGSGSICNDSFAQGPGSYAEIFRTDTAGVNVAIHP